MPCAISWGLMNEIVRLVRPEIYAIKPYSSARTEGTQDASIWLDANENPYPPFPGDDESIGLNRYPRPQPEHLIERFAELYGVRREQLFLSRGADEAIDLLTRAFCRAGEDSILITPPTFVMYETAAAVQGAAVVRIPLLQRERFDLDVDAIVAQRSPSKLVFICSPNNPTSNLMQRDDITTLARELLGKSLVVVDELYVDYSGASSLSTEVDAHPNLVVIRSMSKEYSLAGERCGITIAHPEVVGILRRIMAPYSIPVTAIRSVTKALTPEGVQYGRENIRRILAERDRVRATLDASSAATNIFPSDANFLLVQTHDAALLATTMAEHGIKIRDRSSVVEHAVRISIGTPNENDEMLKAFEEYERRVNA
jgi:histidinol-phosphate aminotransferase